jgi:hypothetical protein
MSIFSCASNGPFGHVARLRVCGRRLRWLPIALMALVPLALADDLTHHAIVPVGGTVTSGNLTLSYTLGEPVAGQVAAGPWRLSSGFQALFTAVADDSDLIFADGFESAGP